MESLYSGLRRTGQTLETDPTLRLPKRPLSNSNPNPNAFENFGSTLRIAPSSSQTQQPKSKAKPQRAVSQDKTRPITIKKPLTGFIKKPLSDFIDKPLSDSLDSDDELDFLSSPQRDPDDYKPSKKGSTSQSDKYADADSKKSQALSTLKFNKIKSTRANATIPPSCSFKNQPDRKENSQGSSGLVNESKRKGAATGECSGDDEILEISSPLHLKSTNRRLSPPQSSLPDSSLPGRPRPRPLPLPRPTCKPNAKPDTIFFDGHELIPLGRSQKTIVTKQKDPSRSPSLSISTPKPKRPLPKPRNKVDPPPSFEQPHELSAFPMPSPQSNKAVETSQPKGKNKAMPFPLDELDGGEADEESGRNGRERTPKGKGKRKQLPMEEVGTPSSKASRKLKASRKPKAFPMPSPQSSDKARTRATLQSQSKGKNKARPFPEEGLSKLQKRISEGLGDDEQQPRKKRRRSLSYVFFMFIFQCRFRGSELIGSDLINIVLKTKAIHVRNPS